MKALVVGTGSIGRRHIDNLRALGFGVGVFSHRGDASSRLSPDIGQIAFTDLASALADGPDLVVVANSTELHVETAINVARRGIPLFIEKPLACSMDRICELKKLVDTRGLIVESGFMMRCHPNLRWLRDFIREGRIGPVMSISASVGQWLPNWRPGTDHRSSYSARVEKGGGVIFDLTHELDLITWLIGSIVDVAAMTRRVDMLEIETEAIAEIILRTSDGTTAQVHLDYVRPGYGRALEVIGGEGVLRWDYVSGTVSLIRPDGDESVVHRLASGYQRNDMFLTHMKHMQMRLCDPSLMPVSSLDEAIAILRVALACHRSALERRFVDPDEFESECLARRVE